MILHTRARRLLDGPGIFSGLSEPVLKAKATRSTNRDPSLCMLISQRGPVIPKPCLPSPSLEAFCLSTIKSRPSVFCPISRCGFPSLLARTRDEKPGQATFDRYCDNTRSGLAPPSPPGRYFLDLLTPYQPQSDTESAGFLGSPNLSNIPPKRWIDGASARATGLRGSDSPRTHTHATSYENIGIPAYRHVRCLGAERL